jgi:hypothetical protein
MAAKKNTEGLAFIVEALKHHKTATYGEIKEAAAKKGLTIWPVMFGRAQLLLGHVKGAKRGTGKYAKATVAKAAGSPRGRQPDASSKSGQIRELLQSGMAPMEIVKKIGCTPGLVYNVKSRLSGNAEKTGKPIPTPPVGQSAPAKRGPGRPRKDPVPTTSSPSGLDAFISVMRNSEAQRDRYRGALQKVQGLMQEIQDTLSEALGT